MVNFDFTRASIEIGEISKLVKFTTATLSIDDQSTGLIGFLGNSVLKICVLDFEREKVILPAVLSFYSLLLPFSFSLQTSLSFVLYLLPNMESGLRSSHQYVFVRQLVSQTGISE